MFIPAVRRWALFGRAAIRPEAQAIFDAFTTPPTSARKTLINALVDDLISGDVWTALDALYLFAAADAQASLINWKSPGTFDASNVNSTTFGADAGYTGDAISMHLETGFDPATDGTFDQDDAHVGVWTRTNTFGANLFDIGVGSAGGSQQILMNPGHVGGTTQFHIINSGSGEFPAVTKANGHNVGVRRGAAATEMYQDGASLGAGTTASSAITAGNSITFLRYTTSYSNRQISAGHFGTQLSDAQVATLYAALNTYLTELGAT